MRIELMRVVSTALMLSACVGCSGDGAGSSARSTALSAANTSSNVAARKAASLAASSASGGSPGAQTGTPISQPSGSINVASYGAVGDGSIDNTGALQNAFNAAASVHQSVYIPTGTYNRSEEHTSELQSQ